VIFLTAGFSAHPYAESARRESLSIDIPTLNKFPKEVLGGIDIQRAFIVSRLIVTAERLQVFRALHGKRMKAASVGRVLKIHKSYRDTFLNSLVSLGLLHRRYLLEHSFRGKVLHRRAIGVPGRGSTPKNACGLIRR
jgi:hypothetical protein